MAAAVAAHARLVWGDAPVIAVVEPDDAPALARSIKEGRAVKADGPVSVMGRLDCKEPSLIALKGLARDADYFLTISEEEAEDGTRRAAKVDFASTPSGAAGIAALLAADGSSLGLDCASHVLTFLTEAP